MISYNNDKKAVRLDSGLKSVSKITRVEKLIVKSASVLAALILVIIGIEN